MGRRKRKVFLWQQNFSGAPKKLKPLKINVRYITTFIYIFNLVKKAMTLESGGNTEQEDVSEHPIRYGIIIKMSLKIVRTYLTVEKCLQI